MPFARTLVLLLASTLLVSLAACGDSSGPGSPVTVDVSLRQLLGPTIYPDSVGEPTVFCTADVRAVARGSASALWLDATLRWYSGSDRSTAIDSSIMPFDEIRGSWGQAGIAPGDTLDTRWELTAYLPFAASIEYRYRPADGGTTRSTTVKFDCSPPVPANVQPPIISSLTVIPPAGDFEPGDTLTVNYAASSAARLWRSYVQLSGPCSMELPVTENLEASVTRTLRIRIPAECRLGVPITVSVITFDAGLRSTTRQAATQLSLVDKTPPWVLPLFFNPDGAGSLTPSGDYFAGDSIQLNFDAGDNAALAVLIWEVLPYGIRDSLIVNTAYAGPRVYIRLRPDWSGPIELRLYARDQQGLVSNVVTSAPNALRVYPTVPRATMQTTVQGEVRELAIDSPRGVVYLLQSNQRRIAVLQLSTMQVTSTLALPSYPQGIDLTPAGDSLIVTLAQGALGIIDLRQSTRAVSLLPLTELDPSLGQRPVRVRVAANGKAFVSLEGSAVAYRLHEVDLRTGTQRRRPDAANGGLMDGIFERSLDHSSLSFMNGNPRCFQKYDAASDAFGPCVSSDIFLTGWPPTLDATGRRTAINRDVYDESLQLLRRAASPITGGGVVPTALSPDGQYLYVAVPRIGIVRSRLSDGTMADRSYVPFLSSDLVRVSADGAVLVVVEGSYSATTRISTIDMR